MSQLSVSLRFTFTSFNLTSSRCTSSAMTLFDQFSDLAGKFAPSKSSGLRGGGIGSGHGMVPIDDVSDCIISVIPLIRQCFNGQRWE